MNEIMLHIGLWQALGAILGGSAVSIGALWKIWSMQTERQQAALDKRFADRDRLEEHRISELERVRSAASSKWEGSFAEIMRRNDMQDHAIDAMRERLTRVEVAVEHLPSAQDIAEIGTRIEHVAGQLDGFRSSLEEAVRGVERQVEIINQYLINRERG